MEQRRQTIILLMIVLAMGVSPTFAPVEAQDDPALVLDGGIQFADGTIQSSALVGFAPVGDTGQKGCWDGSGTAIACSGTGQDGEVQAGSDWPSPRFVDNQDGTVSDVLTGLVWLRDADCFAEQTWEDALNLTNNLMDGTCDLTDGSLATEGRLPNVKEMFSLIDLGSSSPAIITGHPFADVRLAFYWTSTSAVEAPSNAWAVGLASGGSDNGPKTGRFFSWPVRGGQ